MMPRGVLLGAFYFDDRNSQHHPVTAQYNIKGEKQMAFEKKYMERAIELAKKGIGAVNPNPLVGAVIVRDCVIVGEGYHTKYGELHAEREAIKNAN